ncbi:hypothetical protein MMC22_007904 [Lobaria immixta]|nr:hypothetical protein [Lobaria immixta]
MRLTLSLCILLYELVSFSSSQVAPPPQQFIYEIKCPKDYCINIWLNDIKNGHPRRCCGTDVKSPRYTVKGQRVPPFVKIQAGSLPGSGSEDGNMIYVEGGFDPKVTSLKSFSTPGCSGWYELVKFYDGDYDGYCPSIGFQAVASTNPYWIPSLNLLQLQIERSNTPLEIKDYDEPLNLGVYDPVTNIDTPTIHALNSISPLNSETSTTQGSSNNQAFNPISPLNSETSTTQGPSNIQAFNPIGSLNSETSTAQGTLSIPDIMPAKLASTTGINFNPAGFDCTGDGCDGAPLSWPTLDLNVRRKRTPVNFRA